MTMKNLIKLSLCAALLALTILTHAAPGPSGPPILQVWVLQYGTNVLVTPVVGTNLTATFVTNANQTVTMTISGITAAQLTTLMTSATFPGSTTPTEIGYVHNVTGAIQTQLNAKAGTNDTTWFERKGTYTGITNGAVAIITAIVFTDTAGVTHTNHITNGIIQP